MARRGKREIDWVMVVAIIGPLIAGAGTFAITGFITERKLADRPYVDERFIEGKRYTDDKTSAVLKEAFEHSNTTRQEMMLKMEQMNTEYRSGVNVLSTKVDSVLEIIKGMRDDFSARKHK